MGMLNYIIIIVLVVLVIFAFIKAPKETINFVVKVGEKCVDLVKTAYTEGKPVVKKMMENKNNTK